MDIIRDIETSEELNQLMLLIKRSDTVDELRETLVDMNK